MTESKHVHVKTRRRALIIHHSARIKHDLTHGLAEFGWEVFEAEGRADGMRFMYDLHPVLIIVQVVSGDSSSKDFVESIRLCTNVPLVLLMDRSTEAEESPFDVPNVLVLAEPITITKLISETRKFWRVSNRLSGSSDRETLLLLGKDKMGNEGAKKKTFAKSA